MYVRNEGAARLSTIDCATLAFEIATQLSSHAPSWIKARWLQIDLRQRGLAGDDVLDLLATVDSMIRSSKAQEVEGGDLTLASDASTDLQRAETPLSALAAA